MVEGETKRKNGCCPVHGQKFWAIKKWRRRMKRYDANERKGGDMGMAG